MSSLFFQLFSTSLKIQKVFNISKTIKSHAIQIALNKMCLKFNATFVKSDSARHIKISLPKIWTLMSRKIPLRFMKTMSANRISRPTKLPRNESFKKKSVQFLSKMAIYTYWKSSFLWQGLRLKLELRRVFDKKSRKVAFRWELQSISLNLA
jgi:hypothetical protein